MITSMRVRSMPGGSLGSSSFVLLLVLVAACGGPRPVVTERSSTISQPASSIEGVEFPAAEFDPGVMSARRDMSGAEYREILSSVDQAAEPQVSFVLDACRQWAPNRWIVSGTAELTIDGPLSAPVFLTLHHYETSELGWAGQVTVEARGAFAFEFHRRDLDFEMDSVVEIFYVQTWDNDSASACSLSVPVRGRDGEVVEASIDPEPVVYDAPADSIQALGVGARLDQPDDPRLHWAYLAWDELALPFDTVWVPSAPLLDFSNASSDARCSEVSMVGHQDSVSQRPAGCGLPNSTDRITDERVQGVEGFAWANLLGYDGVAAFGTRGDVELTVLAPTREAAIELIESLRPLRNLNVGPVPDIDH